MKLSGCYTAMVTPFKNGAVDYSTLEKLIEQQIAGGVTGLIPVGTTGESPTLNPVEHLEVIGFTVKTVAGRCEIIAGTGANSTEEAITFSKQAADLGITATLQVTPYYNKPTGEGMYRHFTTVAEKSGTDIVLYNVPGRTGKEIPLDIVKRLADHPKVIAIKEAAGSVERVNAIRNICDLTILSGDDSLALPMMSVGASGVISVASNIIPAEVQKMTELALAGDFRGAYEIHRKFYPLFHDLFLESNPIPVKAAMAAMNLIAEEYRLPLCEMSAAPKQTLLNTMKSCGIL